MVMEKTEQELREDTLARRARHDLKNQPLPINKFNLARSQAAKQTQSASLTNLYDKELFKHSSSNRKTLNSLSSARTLTSMAHSRSMQDLSDRTSTDSCGFKRSKSYSRITEQQSAYEQDRACYKSTISDMYTNTSAFSPRSIAAIRQDDRPVIMPPSTVLHLSRLQDPQLRDPCWRARRATSGKEVEKQYQWQSRLGIDRETSGTDINPRLLSRSTPDMTKLGSSQTGRTSIPLPVLVPSLSSGRGDSLTGLSFKTSSLKSAAATSSSNLSVGGGDYMDKTLRQLKVATDWLASLASRPQSEGAEVTQGSESKLPRTPAWKRPPTSSCRPSLSSCAARWSTQGSQRRFEGMRERFV